MKKTTQILSAAILSFTLFSCQKSNNNDLQEAQLCLNKAAASEAQNCVSKISSDTSENAYKLRCAAVFISKGFGSPTSFISALDQIKNGGTGTYSGSLVAMSTLNFGIDAAATLAASQAFSECSNSGVQIYGQISSIFRIGTLITTTATSTNITNMDTAAAAIALAAGAGAEIVGQVAQATYSSTCVNSANSSQSTQQYCSELSAAISSGSTNTAIGQCLLNKMSNPAHICP